MIEKNKRFLREGTTHRQGPRFGGVCLGRRDSAPTGKGFVVNGQMPRADNVDDPSPLFPRSWVFGPQFILDGVIQYLMILMVLNRTDPPPGLLGFTLYCAKSLGPPLVVVALGEMIPACLANSLSGCRTCSVSNQGSIP